MSRYSVGTLVHVAAALSASILCQRTLAADAVQTRIMLVGTYHFANPGQDIHNVTAVDVLSPARQREIEAVVHALARFEPSRVAVEWPAEIVDERYAKFLDGSLPVSRNEVVQLGFRLARDRQLNVVHGIDVPGDFPFEPVLTWAQKHGRAADIEQMMAGGAAEVARISALQERTSIGGVLRDLNAPASIERNHSFYPPILAMGAGADQPGVALLSAWYARNLAICARLLQTLTPGDRVVVLYGQGHIHLLRQCLGEQPNIELIDPLSYLPGANPRTPVQRSRATESKGRGFAY